MSGNLPTPSADSWTDADHVMLVTCRIIADIVAGRLPDTGMATYFRLSSGAVALVSGPLRVLELRANGDGRYPTTSTLVAGTGVLGLALLAGSLAGSAVRTSRARQRAQADARVEFRYQFDAQVYVTTTGFSLQHPDGVADWSWGDIQAMQLVGPHDALLQGGSTRGPVTWRLLTPWAELLLVLWGLAEHPSHPQLADGSWLAPGWLDRARALGWDPVLRSPELR